ncbi:MAG TPA: lysozyme [Gaiellaceae bacterium]|jgi:GH24 family phage-related lysozyme (muramidase)|nr:lysozyme [Gaiellaceae bacterium]
MSQLSERGAQFIGHFEGWRPEPYNDPTNNATIGYGHLIHMGPLTAHDKSEWGTLSPADGIHLLQRDATLASNAVDHYITHPLTQPQRDALISFAFNCGGGALSGSVGKAVNAGQDPTAALGEWVHSGTTLLPGLVDRRKKEAHLYMTGDYGDGQPAVVERQPAAANTGAEIPSPVPAWAWHWVEWKLGRAAFKGHAGDPKLREKTGAPETVPAWAWTFLQRHQ